MADFTYRVLPLSVTSSPAFAEASADELRVLLALIEAQGDFGSESALAKKAGVSRARCMGALAFWEEAGVIKRDDGSPRVSEEFGERLKEGEIFEEESLVVAERIRDENLAEVLDECARLMGLAVLSNTEIKQITALNTQYSLSAEYIMTLAADMASRGRLRAARLTSEAIKLAGSGVDNVELLEIYIKNRQENSGAEWEIRRIMGIYNRTLTKSERERFARWSNEFGYSAEIITEAYDIAVDATGGKNVSAYMDKILTAWHEAGCKTVSECLAKREGDRATLSEAKSAPKKKAKSSADTPRYGNYDINDAFNKALARSYGESGEEE